MQLYHYRSINTALLEIENHSFHFSGKDELNDPLEGYVRVFWKGDKAAWEGLFRNYICSLIQGINLYLLDASRIELNEKSIMVDIHRFDNAPLGRELTELGNKFIANKYCQKFSEIYGNSEADCTSSELQLILRVLHHLAFSMCLKTFVENQIIPESQVKVFLERPIKIVDEFPFDEFEILIRNNGKNNQKKKVFFDVIESVFQDSIEAMSIVSTNDSTMLENDRNYMWLSLSVDFPMLYVSQLKESIYPKGYVVCFSKNNNNSTMWGNYANDHKGACLVYETDKLGLAPAMPVKYGTHQISRNFFETFGSLTYPQITSWLTGAGGTSKYLNFFHNERKWRQQYWNDYNESYFRKLNEWAYEDEYRIFLSDAFHSYDSFESRNLKYNAEALNGIIFGIRTTINDKKQLMDAIKNLRGTLDDFKFYQAEFDEFKQSIHIREKHMFLG